MRISLIIILVLLVTVLTGCAVLDKLMPAQLDEQGNAIPGSRQASAVVQTVADVVPYGNTALTVFIFLLAGYEKFKAYKLEKGLSATLLAGKKIASDPDLQKAWEKIKDIYRMEHETSGSTSLIKALLAKLPSIVKS